MSFLFQLTDAGAALLNADTGPITITTAELGSAFNYVPEATDTNIHGSLVFSMTPSLPTPVTANIVVYSLFLNAELGPFSFGEVGLFTEDGTLFALGAGNELVVKLAAAITPPGNSIRIDCYLSMVGQNYAMWLQFAESDNAFRMAVLGSPDYLPPSNQATPNAYVISGITNYQSSFLAYTNQTGLWNFDAYNFANQATATITSFDTQSVTIALSDYVEAMTPSYLGQVILEFVTGNLYSICRYVQTTVISGNFVTLGFVNPLMSPPIVGDLFSVFERTATSVAPSPQIATTTQLGVVQIGDTLTITSGGLLNVAASSSPVTSFNSRTGAIVLASGDVTTALGFNPAPLASPTFTGVPAAPTASLGTNNTQIATTAFVLAELGLNTVTSFNSRTGAVTFLVSDLTGVGGALLASPAFTGIPTAPTASPGTSTTQLATTAFISNSYAPLANPSLTGVPTAPTASLGTSTTQIATTAFVEATLASGVVTSFNSRTGAITFLASDISGVGGALLASPTFTGVPSAPTATPGTSTNQLATTAFVASAIAGSGVTSFNGRTGAVTLTNSDITTALTYTPANIASPAFTGTPTAPTATVGTNNTQLATTAFVTSAIAASAGVTSFNSRTGAITFEASDITGAGGALLASPALTGVPTAPTATSGTNTTQVATTAFVTAAVSGAGVTSFNSRTGAVNLSFTDVTGALTYTPANLISPTFTGIPQAPTAANGTNSTQLATCAFVLNELSSASVTSFNTRTGAVTLQLSDVTGVGGAPIASPQFTGRVETVASSYTVVALGSVSGTQTLNLVSATEWTLTVTGALTFAFTNTLAAGLSQIICLRITNGGSSTISWPSGTQFANGGTAPTFTASGVDLVAVRYDTTSSTYMVFVIGLNIEA